MRDVKQVWVAGEALIDLIPNETSLVPVVGGGPANTAKALSKLGIPTSFIGGISSDQYGGAICDALEGVDLDLSHKSDLPTALAVVTLDDDGSASYVFKLEGTATFDFHRGWLPKGVPQVLHIGTLATIIEPGATELFEWAKTLGVPIVFDPNVRPSFLSNVEEYRNAVEKWVGISTIVKLSSEDFEWLGYTDTSRFFELGSKLAVVTSGANGITGFTESGSISVPGVKVNVVDTVGAGDTVGAILVEGFLKLGLDGLTCESLFKVLTRAAAAAAITCSRAGANPPNASELGTT